MSFLFRPAKRRRAGFTLIEILLVVLLVGVLAGVVLPSLQVWHGEYELQNAVSRLQSYIAYGQHYALFEQKVVRMVSESNPSRLQLEAAENNDESFEPLAGKQGTAISFPERMSVRLSDTEIFFNPDGTNTHAHIDILYDQKKVTIRIPPVGVEVKVHYA